MATSAVLFLLTGWAAAECVSERGDRVLTDFLTAGDFIGLGDTGPRSSHTVIGLTDVAALRIERTRLRALIDDDPAFCEVYIGALQTMLLRARNRRLALSAKSGAAKVCLVLSDLADRVAQGRDHTGADDDRFRAPISQVHLACAVDLTPVAVNRIVKSLREAGLVEWGASGVRVRDRRRLRDFGSSARPAPRRR